MAAPGSDDILYGMIPYIRKSCQDFLLSLYNKIFREANIIPVPKPGKDAAVPGNYRPVSLMSCLWILLEMMISLRMMWFLEKRKSCILYSISFFFENLRTTTDTFIKTGY